MAKEKTGRVVEVSQYDNPILKQFFLDLENTGVTKTRQQICNDIFSLGLHESVIALNKNTK